MCEEVNNKIINFYKFLCNYASGMLDEIALNLNHKYFTKINQSNQVAILIKTNINFKVIKMKKIRSAD